MRVHTEIFPRKVKDAEIHLALTPLAIWSIIAHRASWLSDATDEAEGAQLVSVNS